MFDIRNYVLACLVYVTGSFIFCKNHTIRGQHILSCFDSKQETTIGQQISQNVLDETRTASTGVSSVPGHIDTAGNDIANEMAKETTELEPMHVRSHYVSESLPAATQQYKT